MFLEYQEAFDLFDENGDGHICESELSKLMSALGKDPTLNEVKDLIHDVDTNGKLIRYAHNTVITLSKVDHFYHITLIYTQHHICLQ